ncbi:hypothetical protein ACFY3U_02520 [Micromonospora sp. NPDC000089]|uniref:hypothetical protein n=1 Tax=unclassified Micromonospora TaxID=2617518 RepID=UPI00367A2E03
MTDEVTARPGPLPTRTRSADRRTARGRRRRRWLVAESLAAVACVAALVAYLGSGPGDAPPAPDGVLPAGAPTVAAPPAAAVGLGASGEAAPASPGLRPRERPPSPTAAPPSGPATGRPGGPLLEVTQADVPATVDLTSLGARDWVHWGLRGPSSVVRKRGGSGEIRDAGGRGARGGYDTNPEFFGWRDGDPVAAEPATPTGVYACGVGNGFALTVAGSGQDRTVHLFAGLWMARGRLDARLSTGGPTRTLRIEDPHTTHTADFVVRFRVAPGERLLLDWTTEQTFNGCGNVDLQAVALR